ncbi:MAG: glyceraldehyde-3-phosphate dehydrogenase [Acidimicrobiia bacterium]|nr:glyceraldehyde-3-phosphate dehydrogenase [Acidimicrobiia bacterium]
MTRTRIGLMGFGRIGRNVFRMVHDHPELEVAAIADTANPEGLTYLLKYDSIYGRFPAPVELQDAALFLDGRRIPFLAAKEPGDANWADLGVDVVVQATGSYRTAGWCQKHLDAGAKRVILASTPDVPGDMPLLLRGVNDYVLDDNPPMVALGSNTSNALAPILKIVDSAFGLQRAYFTVVHAMTNSQRLADVPSEGFRQSRAAGENIIPAETNSADILTQVLPEFAGKLSGVALNVPVADGSTVDLVAEVKIPATREAVNAAVRSAAEGSYRNVLEYVDDPIVSSDVHSSTHSGVYDSLATMVMDDTLVKTITWFNNGWGYTARLIEVVSAMTKEGASA